MSSSPSKASPAPPPLEAPQEPPEAPAFVPPVAAPPPEELPPWGLTEPWPVQRCLAAVLREMPALGKDEWNDQQKFHFRGHDAVMNAYNPLAAKYGIVVFPRVLERVPSQRQTRSGSVMYEVNLLIQFEFVGPSGDSFVASGWGEGTDMGDKSTSKATTMAFKYVLNTVLALSTEEAAAHDADRTSPEDTVGQQQASGAGARPPAQPAAPGITDRIADLERYTADAKPWIVEAVKTKWDLDLAGGSFQGVMGDKAGACLSALASVVAQLGEHVGTGMAPYEASDDDLRAALRLAFATAFEVAEVRGPDEFVRPIPFS